MLVPDSGICRRCLTLAVIAYRGTSKPRENANERYSLDERVTLCQITMAADDPALFVHFNGEYVRIGTLTNLNDQTDTINATAFGDDVPRFIRGLRRVTGSFSVTGRE